MKNGAERFEDAVFRDWSYMAQAKEYQSHQKLEEARNRFSPRVSRERTVLPTPPLQLSETDFNFCPSEL